MPMIKSIFLRITGALAFFGLIFGFPQSALAQFKVTQPLLDHLTQSIQLKNLSMTTLLLAAAGGLLLIAIILLIVMIFSTSRRKKELGAVSWQAPLQAPGAGTAVSTKPRRVDVVAPIPAPIGIPLGALIILFSDDPSMINQRIEIDLPVTHLGRKVDNDIIFVKDSPVSRHHAVIESRSGQLYLGEVIAQDDATGQPKRPAYGTFVNGVQVQQPVLLKDGDEIMLGKRLRMRFEITPVSRVEDESTVYQVEPGPDDTTIAAYNEEAAKPSSPEQEPSISSSGEKALSSEADERTVLGSTPDEKNMPKEEDDTLVSRLGKKPNLPDQEDKTMPTGGRSG